MPTDIRIRQIVEAALALLATHGLEGLTIRKVLQKTRLSRRAFYERFSGKDDMILAVFEDTITTAAFWLGKQIETMSDPMERLRFIVMYLVLGAETLGTDRPQGSDRRHAALVREHMRLAESRPADLHEALRPLISLIAAQLGDGMKAGRVRDYSAQRLATLIYNVVSATIHTQILAEEGSKPDAAYRIQLANEIWGFCRPAIAA